ncbi:hypothetical protein [Sphingobacterium mizutaii]|nr:hypothetical protein [Sphingobacterium mizutaii]
MFISMMTYFSFLTPYHNWGDDFALYLNQANSLIKGEVDTLILKNSFAIKNSSRSSFSPILAPWGWPSIIAVIIYFFGLNIVYIKIIIILFFYSFLLIFGKIIYEKNSAISSFSILSILVFNSYYFDHTNVITTEIPFLFFSSIILYLTILYKNRELNVLFSLFLGFLIAFNCLIRTEGILFLPIILFIQISWSFNKITIDSLWKRNNLIIISPYLGFLIVYLLSKIIFPTVPNSHLSFLNKVSLETVYQSILWYSNGFQKLFLIDNQTFYLKYILYTFFFVGIFKFFWKEFVLSSFTIGLLIIYLIWPYYELRYLFMVFPFVLYFTIKGCYIFSYWVFKNNSIAYVLIAGLILSNSIQFIKNVKETNRITETEGPYTRKSKEMFQFVKTNIPKDKIVSFFRPRAFTFFTGCYSVMIYHSLEDIMKISEYLIINNYTNNFQISPISIKYSNQLKNGCLTEIYSNGQFDIYKIKKTNCCYQ